MTANINVEQKAQRLAQRNSIPISEDELIELCFAVIEHHSDPTEQCRAAVILSGVVKAGLGERASIFIDRTADKLPPRAREVLSGAIMRMGGF